MTLMTVAVIDYGMGNLHSVAKALEKVAAGGTQVLVSSDPQQILAAGRVVLPGVGAIRDCMHELARLGLDHVVCEVAASGKPLLGVCVGMQALMEFSEENGGTPCLGVLPGKVTFIGNDLHDARGERLKVPHMGWNQVHQSIQHPLWDGIAQDSRFYFVHSYCVRAEGTPVAAATTDYGVCLAAAVARKNVFATQFHPEKSARDGLQLYANFLRWSGDF